MFQPANIVLVRHGMSEHNLARERSKAGDDSDWETKFINKHTSQYRLTDIGREQSILCGEFIKENITNNFDRYFASEYLRTIETAYYLGFKDAKWEIDFTIRERDKGKLSGLPEKEKEKEFYKDDFYSSPLGGESIANLCLRVDRFIDFLNKECVGLNVIIVTHGTIMEAFRIRLEKLLRENYNTIKKQKIKNCQIIWYTQRNPYNNSVSGSGCIEWVNSICPYNNKYSFKEWKKIENVKYTNNDLYSKFSKMPIFVNNTSNERSKICSKNNGCKN